MEILEDKKLSVYNFGNKRADGSKEQKNLLGGKGANLAEMSRIGIPVPPGFTITTEICTQYNEKGKKAIVDEIQPDVRDSISMIEDTMGGLFGDSENPLLLSVRSGARVSMPGMMDTVLNLGLNDESVKGMIDKTGNERFVWDSYRRFIQMYSGVVLGLKPENKEDLDPFEEVIDHLKMKREIELDTDFTIADLKDLVYDFKEIVKKRTGNHFPSDPWEQLWGAVMGGNPSEFRSPRRPVENVSWDDVQEFLAALGERVPGLEPRLPTEAWWEYACRAGTESAIWLGDLEIFGKNNAPLLDEIAWYGGNSGVSFDLQKGRDSSNWPEKQFPHRQAGTRKVGLKCPNPWGLFDMLGNVFEFCSDYWIGEYSGGASLDPTGPGQGSMRAFRGGAWNSAANCVRAADRGGNHPGDRSPDIGFRISRDPG